MLGVNSIFERKRLKIAKFFTLKRSKILGGSVITALCDTNPSDATGSNSEMLRVKVIRFSLNVSLGLYTVIICE